MPDVRAPREMLGMSGLAPILNMLASDHAGERASAALIIARKAHRAGKTVAEFLATTQGPDVLGQRTQRDDLLDKLLVCADHVATNEWERQFARDVALRYGRARQLSVKQREHAENIVLKVQRHEAAAREAARP